MRIYSKKVFGFNVDGETILTPYEGFFDIKDELANDNFFKLAVKEGSILILNSENKKSIENGDFPTDLEVLSLEELLKYAEENGIDIGKATTQSGVLAKIKEQK
ncbi:hypothetical protein [Clostridium butyricum]|jgi:hypothetical protein|uniref:hypothetical protein n=1 Tax=Clostridium butyricum TaxID=1492 RepID=UPI0009040944|nr:hypothetical protein [Clostridium butyricum]APF21599.1 hypothetical protein NPD4_3558 [Clostridium butyricum]DAN05399.1 MAG TPA: HeH/LEM domain [Caudoviricetes sp.]